MPTLGQLPGVPDDSSSSSADPLSSAGCKGFKRNSDRHARPDRKPEGESSDPGVRLISRSAWLKKLSSQWEYALQGATMEA